MKEPFRINKGDFNDHFLHLASFLRRFESTTVESWYEMYGKEQKLNSCEVFISITNKNQGKEYCSLHWLYQQDPYNVWICHIIGITGWFTSLETKINYLGYDHNYEWSKLWEKHFLARCYDFCSIRWRWNFWGSKTGAKKVKKEIW